ncbi:hypothetical protein Rumeso_00987 [Rubellimicrobium mesophilum DSM 19309]|uniref:DUF2169 domain-containing protein n=1 Tax=Rubellimicrobium mesophilum DSM 19309 TaxID=442562 RepID=A0A017HTF3_9RHOB|nr:DUF2169 domain-containing protein [Rubellimicrobium mesophilum]EYD77438.1 hypothetical protein Rumeso_00987 [Rubellimicrobium mesophilum DSM 19309]
MNLQNGTPWPANLTIAFDKNGHEQVVVVTKATFELPVVQGNTCRPSSAPLPLTEADVFGPDPGQDAVRMENDFAPHKPLCDIVCYGDAFAPDGRPVTELGVGLRLGNWSKVFTVHGSRIWLKTAGGYRVSDKRPFVRQPIGYDHAFGGTDPDPDDPSRSTALDENPAGLGYYPNLRNREGAALAHTSEFRGDATDPTGRFPPRALGPVGRNWLPRRRHVGTYDEAWTESRMPFLPEDFDYRYFQTTAEDQQIPYPQGGEPIEIVNLSPSGRIATQLPTMEVVVVFERKSGRITQRVANLDTVAFFPEQGLLTMAYRTRITAERDIFEFARITVSAHGPEGAISG